MTVCAISTFLSMVARLFCSIDLICMPMLWELPRPNDMMPKFFSEFLPELHEKLFYPEGDLLHLFNRMTRECILKD